MHVYFSIGLQITGQCNDNLRQFEPTLMKSKNIAIDVTSAGSLTKADVTTAASTALCGDSNKMSDAAGIDKEDGQDPPDDLMAMVMQLERESLGMADDSNGR